MPGKTRLRLERLEDRRNPATWGNAWPDAGHLTLSFAPDGTAVGDRTSSLFAAFDAVAPRALWQRELLRAFQTWAVNANINISITDDGGQSFGSDGSPQGDSRFGDIRIAAYPTGGTELALASPFDPAAGTWAGDVKVDLNAGLGVNGNGSVDLYSALLHEAGHVFGLSHSTNSLSPLYEAYQGVQSGLIAEDIARLQTIYGPRTPDAYEGSNGNESMGDATPLNLLQNTDGSLASVVEGDITTASDCDYYSFTTPLLAGSAYIRLSTAGMSLLTPRLTVFTSTGQVVQSTAATDPGSGDLVVTISGLKLLSKYYVKVEGAATDAFGIGSYQLKVQRFPLLGALTGATLNLLNQTTTPVFSLLANQDLHTNDSILTATLLPPLFSQADGRFDATYRGSISDGVDRDFYRVTAPAGTSTLTAMAWATPGQGGSLTPRVHVYTAQGVEVQSEVIVNDAASTTIQIPNATPSATYYVDVEASNTTEAGDTGDYFLGVDFGSQMIEFEDFVKVSLYAQRPIFTAGMKVDHTELYHFALSATSRSNQNATATLVIRNDQNEVVFTMTASTAEVTTARVVLRPGHYVRSIVGAAANGSALAPLSIRLRGLRLDDPIGPMPVDTTESPEGAIEIVEEEEVIFWFERDNWDDGVWNVDEPYSTV